MEQEDVYTIVDGRSSQIVLCTALIEANRRMTTEKIENSLTMCSTKIMIDTGSLGYMIEKSDYEDFS